MIPGHSSFDTGLRRSLARFFCYFCTLLAVSLSLDEGHAEEAKPMSPEAVDVATQLAGLTSQEFQKLVDRTQKSVVVVETLGRDGKTLGVGSGFIVSEDGLIATNLHVIGEARPIRVKLYDQRQFPVVEVYGTDKTQDVALIRIEANELKRLSLGDVTTLKPGQPIFALGNPLGLEHSVVTGVVSGFRDTQGMSMIQLAIPIELGNSGGPLLDMQGQVHGLLTLKSQLTENLGYAVKASAVNSLLEAPNPIPMSRWMTIGTLNPKLWEPNGQLSWKHRAGVISVEGVSPGFGGRALCFSKLLPPETPYDLAVDVKLKEEDGAAGLIFHADGGDIHYGFYPSSGALRLTRFDGPTVYSWHVLQDVRSSAYRPGEWNRLKVRITEDRLFCYCNDQLVIEHIEPQLLGGKVGVVKFRHTTASFKRFQFAKELPSETPDQASFELAAELGVQMQHQRPPKPEQIKKFTHLDAVQRKALLEQARILEERAVQLRRLAQEIHEEQVRQQLVEVLKNDQEEPTDLIKACLLIAALDNQELDITAYDTLVEQLVDELLATFPDSPTPQEKHEALKEFMFVTNGFHGSHTNYYHASNSYINEVIDDREGLPLTLSILFVELARRVGLQAEGIGLPGHFIASVQLEEGKTIYVDVFDQGEELTERQCRRRVREFSGLPWNPSYLDPQPADAIIQRMLRNLLRVANNEQDLEAALRYTKTILAIAPPSYEDRLYYTVLCYSTDRLHEAFEEVNAVLAEAPEEIELQRVRELKQAIEAKLSVSKE